MYLFQQISHISKGMICIYNRNIYNISTTAFPEMKCFSGMRMFIISNQCWHLEKLW